MTLAARLLAPGPSPGRTVLVVDDTPWTQSHLAHTVDQAAHWLLGQGLEAGSRLLWQVPRDPVLFALHLAALRLGIATAPHNPRSPAQEVARALAAIRPDLAVLTGEGVAHVDGRRCLGAQAVRDAILQIDPPAHAAARPAVSGDAIALLGSTSGTTGAPKVVPLRHRALSATIDALAARWHLGPDDVLVHTLPLFHIHGLVVAQYGLLACGGQTVWLDGFDVDDTLAAMHHHHATVMMGVPTHYRRLMAQEALDLPRSLRFAASGSAPMSAHEQRAFRDRTGVPLIQRYGMTEIGIVLSDDPTDPHDGTVGTPLDSVEARVVGPDGEAVSDDTVGELLIRGPSVFDGYEGRPDATADALRSGWMHTGDLVSRDAEGRITIRGRRSALVISGGFNVYPAEVEAALATLPGVVEAGVTGMADPDLGEVPVASVVGPNPSAGRSLLASLRTQLAAYKIPHHLACVPALPRNAMGKLDRVALRAAWSTVGCREAVLEDVPRLAAWNRHMAEETEDLSLDVTVSEAGVRHGIEQGEATYVVAEIGGGLPVGQLMITTEWSDWRDTQVWWIQSVFVPTLWRRRGVLRALFDHVEATARAQGVAGLRLYVDKTNTGAIDAYRRLGWNPDHYQLFERMFDR